MNILMEHFDAESKVGWHANIESTNFVSSLWCVSGTMDNRQVLVNILTEMQNNLRVILRLSKEPSDESIQDRFYSWIREPSP